MKGDIATCEAWEAGYARFEARQSADDGIVTSASSSAEKLALFNLLFVMRGDVYAKSYFNKKTGRVGYTPACAHEWDRGVCGKPRVKCADCPHREFLPLDGGVLRAHFRGTGPGGRRNRCWLSPHRRRQDARARGRLRQGRLVAVGRRVSKGMRTGGRAGRHSSARGQAAARMRGCSSASQ